MTPREFDKLMIYMVAEIALKRKAKGIKLNYPEAVAMISAAALDGADPVSLLAFLFTPIFQVLFIVLVGFYYLTHNVAVAITDGNAAEMFSVRPGQSLTLRIVR